MGLQVVIQVSPEDGRDSKEKSMFQGKRVRRATQGIRRVQKPKKSRSQKTREERVGHVAGGEGHGLQGSAVSSVNRQAPVKEAPSGER